MKDSMAQLLLNRIMAGNDSSDASEVPSTSGDAIDYLTFGDDNSNVFYFESPMWTESSSSTGNTTDSQIIELLPSEGPTTEDPLSDLVKGELQHTIRSRRHLSGQDDIVVEFNQPQKDQEEQLTEEEAEKRRLRREKNRLAAQKCRGKKRERADNLEGTITRLENRQTRFNDEIERLMREKEHLEDIINIHQMVCPKMRKISDS